MALAIEILKLVNIAGNNATFPRGNILGVFGGDKVDGMKMQMTSDVWILRCKSVSGISQENDRRTLMPLLARTTGLQIDPAETTTFLALITTFLCVRSLVGVSTASSAPLEVQTPSMPIAVTPSLPKSTLSTWNPSKNSAPFCAAAGSQLWAGPFFSAEPQPKWQWPQ